MATENPNWKSQEIRYNITLIYREKNWKKTFEKLNPFTKVSFLKTKLQQEDISLFLAKDIKLFYRTDEMKCDKLLQDFNMKKNDKIYIKMPQEYQTVGRIELEELFKSIFQFVPTPEESKTSSNRLSVNSRLSASSSIEFVKLGCNRLSLGGSSNSGGGSKSSRESKNENDSKKMYQSLDQINAAFLRKIKPKRVGDAEAGTSGSYFLQNTSRENIGIFKPFDEQPFAPNNPHGFPGQLGSPGFRKGFFSGQSWYREVVPYILDKEGYFSVPLTSLVEVYHPKFQQSFSHIEAEEDVQEDEQEGEEEKNEVELNTKLSLPIRSQFEESTDVSSTGTDQNQANQSVNLAKQKNQQDQDKSQMVKRGSFQVFVKGCESAADYGTSVFSDHQVHQIAILDIRILNCDRNDENILVKKKRKTEKDSINEDSKQKSNISEYDFQLIPIDHGLCLPDQIEICDYELTWMSWPQAKKPFSKKEIKIIQKINPYLEAENLRQYLKISRSCLRNFVLAAELLQQCAENELTLHDIGLILYRQVSEESSPIEKIIKIVEEQVFDLQKSGAAEEILGRIKNSKIKKSGGSAVKNPDLDRINQQEEEDQNDDSSLSPLESQTIQNQKCNFKMLSHQEKKINYSDEAQPTVLGDLDKLPPDTDNKLLLPQEKLGSSETKKIQKSNSNPELLNQVSMQDQKTLQKQEKFSPTVFGLSQAGSQDLDSQKNQHKKDIYQDEDFDLLFFHFLPEHLDREIQKRQDEKKKQEQQEAKRPGGRRARFKSQDSIM